MHSIRPYEVDYPFIVLLNNRINLLNCISLVNFLLLPEIE